VWTIAQFASRGPGRAAAHLKCRRTDAALWVIHAKAPSRKKAKAPIYNDFFYLRAFAPSWEKFKLKRRQARPRLRSRLK
jgi:hypothetical protein